MPSLRHYRTLRPLPHAFGTVAIEDFQWRSGLTRGDITPAVAAPQPELVNVQIGPYPTPVRRVAPDPPRRSR